MESTKYEEEACRKITESGNADNIYLEHYEHGDIYIYILSYSNGDTAKTEGCALKNGQILTVNAEYKTQDMTKIVPMIKDILDSAEYISDEELPSEVSTIENEFFKLSVEPKYICEIFRQQTPIIISHKKHQQAVLFFMHRLKIPTRPEVCCL